MEDLRALINLLSQQKLKQIEILGDESTMSQKSMELYEGIKSNIFHTDNDAAKHLYNSDENHPNYRKLKYRFKQRLLNTLFFIDVQQYSRSNYEKATLRSLKNWTASKILESKGLPTQGYNLSENILKTTLKYDLVELSLFIVKDLKKRYGLFKYNKYKYQKYSELYLELKTTYDFLEQSEDFYTQLARIIINSKSYEYNNEVKKLETKVDSLISKSKSIDCYMLKFYAFNAYYFIHMIRKDNHKLLVICEQALKYFQKKKDFGNLALFSFIQKKGIAELSLGNYESAYNDFTKCLSFNPSPGSTTWQFIHNYIFNIYILKKDYSKACETVSYIVNHKKFNSIYENYRQPWHLKEAFIHFLIKIGKIDINESHKNNLRQFRLSRFLNEVPEISKDKRGLNITVNILQMLFLIVDEEYDKVLDKLAALKQYNFRYLKRPEYARSSNFIKMLLKIPEADYNLKQVKQKSQKYYNLLIQTPMDFSEQSLNIEIIPYEQLWSELLEMLNKQN